MAQVTTSGCRHEPEVDETYEWIEPTLDGSIEVITITGECRACGTYYTISKETQEGNKPAWKTRSISS